MPLQVGIVGLPGVGKTTVFNALTGGSAEAGARTAHVGMATISDQRLHRVAAVAASGKVTAAAMRVVDPAGTGSAQLGELRSADALLAVVGAFTPDAEPSVDLEKLELELLAADVDHVERRLERVRREAKSGEAALKREVEALEAVLEHVEAGLALGEFEGGLPPQLEPLTTKPLVVVENGPDGIDAKLEVELAELEPEEAAAFRDGRPSALDEVVQRLKEGLQLLTFFTANENEARAWTLRAGQTALEAAATVHSDMARGFIRCEVIAWRDLVECGSRAEAARRGLQRLEGKGYVVQDGDVLNIRFNV